MVKHSDPRIRHWRQIVQMIFGLWIGFGLYSVGETLDEAYVVNPIGFHLPPFADDPWGYIHIIRHDTWERTRFRWLFMVGGGLTFLVGGLDIARILPDLMVRDQK